MSQLVNVTEIDHADVYKAGVLAASLTRNGDDVTFAYTQDYLANANAPAVAYTLPKSERAVVTHASHVHPFFAGLLPEGLRLQATISAARTSADDHFSLLLAVGSDTIGDVQVVPHDSTPDPASANVDLSSPGDLDFAEVFGRAISGDAALLDRRALPGVQAKVSASMLSTPLRTRHESAILKLNPSTHPLLVENEHFFLKMASDCGLTVPAHQLLHDRTGATALLVPRFDRAASGAASSLRFAQEDACQVLDRYPGSKYRVSLQETITALATAVGELGGSAASTALQALEIAVFSYIIGNGDLHAKNLSILQSANRPWMLSPAYDILSTRAYVGDDDMALEFYGRRGRMQHAHWIESAGRLGIREGAIQRSLTRLCEQAGAWAERTGEIGFDAKVTSRLSRLITERCEELTA